MNAKPFLDTNVVLYAFREGDSSGQMAEALLARGGLISVQVLNEFAAVARRKLNKGWEEVRRALRILRVFCLEPAPLTVKTHEAALQIAERYKYSIYDGLIIAAALETGVQHSEFRRPAGRPSNREWSDDSKSFQELNRWTVGRPVARRIPHSDKLVPELIGSGDVGLRTSVAG